MSRRLPYYLSCTPDLTAWEADKSHKLMFHMVCKQVWPRSDQKNILPGLKQADRNHNRLSNIKQDKYDDVHARHEGISTTTTEMAAAAVEVSADSSIRTVLNKLDGIFSQKKEKMTALKAFVDILLSFRAVTRVVVVVVDQLYACPIASRGILVCTRW